MKIWDTIVNRISFHAVYDENIIDALYGFDMLKEPSHLEIVDFLYSEAKMAIEKQLEICMAHLKEEELPNSAILGLIDVEVYAKKFDFPPPGKTTGAVHDNLCIKFPTKGIITLGIGPDFIVLRSRRVIINFPNMIKELQKKLPSAGIEGGGHEVVGSIKFIEGMQKEVIMELKNSLGICSLEKSQSK